MIGQWHQASELRALIQAYLNVRKAEISDQFLTLQAMRNLDTAEGWWLDQIGLRMGYPRPVVSDTESDVFGFDLSKHKGFNQARFLSATRAPLIGIGDDLYRQFLRARRYVNYAAATMQNFDAAVREIDPGAQVTDNLDMTVTVRTDRVSDLELARDTLAVPKPAGVKMIVEGRDVFGFDDSGYVGFNQGPFRTGLTS